MVNLIWFNPPKDMPIPVSQFPNVNFHSVLATIDQTRFSSMDAMAEIIVIDAHQTITPDMWARFPSLKKVITASSRISHIQKPPEEIEIYRIGGEYCAQTIAEKVGKYLNHFEGTIKQPIRDIGIIGFGVIGQTIYANLSADSVYYYDAFYGSSNDHRKRTLEQIKEFCDAIIVCCPDTEITRKMFPRETMFGNGPVIINLSSDSVIPIKILDDWLNRGRIRAYWSDFGITEHHSPTKIITPHNAWESNESKLNKFNETIKLIKETTRLEKCPTVKNAANPQPKDTNTAQHATTNTKKNKPKPTAKTQA